MLRVSEMLQSIFALLAAPDPVDSWLYRICQSHGIDCTITWRRLLLALSASLAATVVYFFVRIRRARWEVTYTASLCHSRAYFWAVVHRINLRACVQKRLATVERRSKELAEIFIKYEKSNIQRMEVSVAPDGSHVNAWEGSQCVPPTLTFCFTVTKRTKHVSSLLVEA